MSDVILHKDQRHKQAWVVSPELQSIEIRLGNLDGPLPIAAVRAHALNGLFHAELGRRHPALVDELHHSQMPMPFSLAPVHDGEQFLGFRIGTLTRDMGQRVADVWADFRPSGPK